MFNWSAVTRGQLKSGKKGFGVDMVAGAIKEVADLATLRELEGKEGQAVFLKDGNRSGWFFGKVGAPGTYTDDDGITIVPGDGSFAWVRPSDEPASPFWFGYTLDVSELDTPEKVNANWARMKAFLNAVKMSKRKVISFEKMLTLEQVFAEWYSGRSCPIGFYSDSTTDGATTTSHIASTGSTSPFAVTINESPNAYPAKLEQYVKDVRKSTTPVRCYNGGFDSQSYLNGFGLLHWYNTWFRGTYGSNVDWSDVKMIVLGFGTSDSINQNDPGGVIDAYSLDLECTIIDCLLRGVQPVLQGPVLTTMHVGETIEYRNSKESLVLIETVQKELCRKYDLEWLSIRESMEKALNNFGGLKYKDLMAADMVHPNDMGHRVHAMELTNKFYPALARLEEGKQAQHIFAGHPAYIPVFDEIISPEAKGGVILKTIGGVVSDDTYFYSWKAEDGNQKAANSLLLRLPVWVEEPCMLYFNQGQGSVGSNRVVNIFSKLTDTYDSVHLESDTYATANAAQRPWNRKTQVCLLTYGLNIVEIMAGSSTSDWAFVSAYLAPLRELRNIKFIGRGSEAANYVSIEQRFPDNADAYVRKQARRPVALDQYYNGSDNILQVFNLTLTAALNGGVTYGIYTHYNDWSTWQDCYNLIEIMGDDVTLKVSYGSGAVTVNTANIPGLNALLVAGANIRIQFKPQFFNTIGIQVQLLVDGVAKYNYTASLGTLWHDGYGFDAPNILCKNVGFVTRRAIKGVLDLDRAI